MALGCSIGGNTYFTKKGIGEFLIKWREGLKGITPEKNVLQITPSHFSTSKLHKANKTTIP